MPLYFDVFIMYICFDFNINVIFCSVWLLLEYLHLVGYVPRASSILISCRLNLWILHYVLLDHHHRISWEPDSLLGVFHVQTIHPLHLCYRRELFHRNYQPHRHLSKPNPSTQIQQKLYRIDYIPSSLITI